MKCSNEQRAKVRNVCCLVCGFSKSDPAHVIDRSLGGCNSEKCVVPLCRRCHRMYDETGMDLLPYLEPDFREEIAHGVLHVGLSRAYARITGRRPENL